MALRCWPPGGAVRFLEEYVTMNAQEYEAVAAILEQAARAFRQLAANRPVLAATDAGIPPGAIALSVREAAEQLGVSRATVYGLINSGNLPSVKIGSRRLISREALREWLGAQA